MGLKYRTHNQKMAGAEVSQAKIICCPPTKIIVCSLPEFHELQPVK